MFICCLYAYKKRTETNQQETIKKIGYLFILTLFFIVFIFNCIYYSTNGGGS